jgi:hypothetical protein
MSNSRLYPPVESVCLDTLIELCVRQGIPLLKADRLGRMHILRTPADLAAFTEKEPTMITRANTESSDAR